jgi:hypothetical protein
VQVGDYAQRDVGFDPAHGLAARGTSRYR